MKYIKQLTLISIFTFIVASSIAQMPINKNIAISKENLSQILTNNMQKQTITIVFDGFDSIPNDIGNGMSILKINDTEIATPKKKATVEITNNIDKFRNYLEKNEVKLLFVDDLKIRVSNIINQEEANKKMSSIIDTPALIFKTEYNDSSKVECYQFRLYYYETKLYVSMEDYSTNLVKGYIDLYQTRIEETKAILNKFN